MRLKHEICDSKCLPISVLYEVAATELKTLHLKLFNMIIFDFDAQYNQLILVFKSVS